jgi:hypothetical protein
MSKKNIIPVAQHLEDLPAEKEKVVIPVDPKPVEVKSASKSALFQAISSGPGTRRFVDQVEAAEKGLHEVVAKHDYMTLLQFIALAWVAGLNRMFRQKSEEILKKDIPQAKKLQMEKDFGEWLISIETDPVFAWVKSSNWRAILSTKTMIDFGDEYHASFMGPANKIPYPYLLYKKGLYGCMTLDQGTEIMKKCWSNQIELMNLYKSSGDSFKAIWEKLQDNTPVEFSGYTYSPSLITKSFMPNPLRLTQCRDVLEHRSNDAIVLLDYQRIGQLINSIVTAVEKLLGTNHSIGGKVIPPSKISSLSYQDNGIMYFIAVKTSCNALNRDIRPSFGNSIKKKAPGSFTIF